MKKALFILAALIALPLGSSELSAMKEGPGDGPQMRGSGHRGGGHHEKMFFGDPEFMKEKLGLSDSQVQKIGDINLDYRKKLLAIKEKIAPMRMKLESMLLEDSVDLVKVRSMIKEMSDMHVEIRMLRIMQRLEIEKILTREQKNKLKSFRMDRMGMGPPDGPDEE